MVKLQEEKLLDYIEESALKGKFKSAIFFPVPDGILRVSTESNISAVEFLKKIYKIRQALKKYKPDEFYFAYTETVGDKYFFENIEKIIRDYGSIEAYPNIKSTLQILHQTKASRSIHSRDIIYDNKGKCIDLYNYQVARTNKSYGLFLPVYIVEDFWKKERIKKVKKKVQKEKKMDEIDMEREPQDISRIINDHDNLYDDQVTYIHDMLPYLEGFSMAVLAISLDNVKTKELLEFISDIEKYYMVGTEAHAFQEAVKKGGEGLYTGEIVLSRYLPFIEMYFHNKKVFPQLSLMLAGLSITQTIEMNGSEDTLK